MQVLLAVVEDLYTFAITMLFPWRESQNSTQLQLYLPASRVVSPVRERVEVDVYRDVRGGTWQDATGAVATDERIVEASQDGESGGALPQRHTIVYCARTRVPLSAAPDNTVDGAIATVAYGDMVMVLEAGPEYTHVVVGNKTGYMPTAALTQKAAHVYPVFVIGAENGADASNTTRLRSVIRDEFGAGFAQLPLHAHEYVYYKLLRRGTRISWPDVRPRTPGAWANILSTLENVTASSMPAVGSIAEFAVPENKAHLAYVEKVFPDLAIQISEADWPERGIYNERVLPENEWRALNPTFITIT
ncbi:MAG: hypothetical protein U1A28_01315 [Patescibacteria group bacterium]|nr:hypothetical protein [Patescibacteria group bacterium]